jgi:predicted transcriptional regulator
MDRPGNRGRNETVTKKMHHRDYYQKMGTMLKFILEEGKPVTEWRLIYVSRIAAGHLATYLEEMEKYRLIKRVSTNDIKRGPRKYGEVGNLYNPMQKHIQITPKGKRLITLIEGMAALMPKAPWILENDY